MREFVRRMVTSVNGLSTPLGGIQWVPPTDERDIARRILNLLEDHRVLFAIESAEVPRQCHFSVQQLRKDIRLLIDESPEDSIVEGAARSIRSACREFIDTVEKDRNVLEHGNTAGHWASWLFLPALGRLRSLIGLQLSILEDAYKLKVSEDLRTILPPKEKE